jgi:hypothetical protein
MAKAVLMRLSCTESTGAGYSGSSSHRYCGTDGLFFQPFWKARYLSALTFAPPIHSEVKPPCE